MTEEEILLEFERLGISEEDLPDYCGDPNEFALGIEKCSMYQQIPFYQTNTTAE